MKKLLCALLALTLFAVPALADSDLSGYSITDAAVSAVSFVDITAPCSGTLCSFDLAAGDSVEAGQTLFTMLTTDICAQEDGTVTALFAHVGDDASAVMQHYGSLGAMDAAASQRITASTNYAADGDENSVLHVGQILYFRSYWTGKEEKGSGVVVAVSGKNYVVEVQEGTFQLNETISLYRSDAYKGTECTGRGTVSQRDPVLFSGAGRIVEVCAEVGDAVKAGQRLFSCLSADADSTALPQITAPSAGVVSAVAVSAGQQVWKGELLCRVWLTDELEITADVDEVDLRGLKAGDSVKVTLDTDPDSILTGIVTEISSLGVTRQNAASYTVHVKLQGRTDLMLGQSASLYLPKE